ncbi:MFS transporter [Salipiger sp. IMCC34102]|nr:MFS transporter [Salipiger sp. IMCC34102]
MFALNGALFGIWASRIPVFVERFDVSSGTLGLLLLCLAGGAILSFPIAGRVSDRMGASALTRALALFYVVALCLLAVAPSLEFLAVCLAMFGATHGAMDVAMNSWGADVEKVRRRPLMPMFHAMYSLGAGLGAASGYGAARAGITPEIHFATVGLFATVLALVLARVRWQSPRTMSGTGPSFSLPRGALLFVGTIAFSASVGEGAMADWSAVLLADVIGATEARAALGYAVFSVAMVATRLSGPVIISRLGAIGTARASGAIAAVGAVMLVLSQGVATALIGFVLLGIGYATIMPLAFSRAAAEPGIGQGQAIASVATLGDGGMLLGPPLIGAVAEFTGLRTALLLLAVLSATIVLLYGRLRAEGRQSAAQRKDEAA